MNNQEKYVGLLEDIYKNGSKLSPRGKNISEIVNTVLQLEPVGLAFDLPGRPYNWKYLAAELLWYLSGDRKVEDIGKFAKLWIEIADENGEITSNYGNLVLDKVLPDGLTQYDFCLAELLNDKDTRQALIRYNSNEHAYIANKDKPCTISNQFMIRENKLHCIVNMRSNDLFFGFAYDFAWFGLLTQSIYLDLKEKYPELQLGTIYWNTGSSHIYEPMYGKVDKIIEEDISEFPRFDLVLLESFSVTREKIKKRKSEFWEMLAQYQGNERDFLRFYLDIYVSIND